MVFDAHTHMPSEGWSGHTSWIGTVVKAVDYLKAAGTDAALFNTWQGVLAETEEDLDQGNAAALELAEKYEGFLYPGACIHPAFSEASRRWLKHFRDQGHLWVGELVNYRKPYNYIDFAFMELVADCARHGHVLQLHSHEDIYEVASRFPDLNVVCAHIQTEVCTRLAELPNVWLDISGSAGGLCVGSIETAYEAFGADRLLYGTDFTGYEPRSYHVRLETAVPSAADRDKILSKNILRLLDIVGSHRP